MPDPLGVTVGCLAIWALLKIYRHADDLGDGNIDKRSE
jgi:hypothetical protein